MSSPAPRPPRARRRPALVVESMERRELMAAKVQHALAPQAQHPTQAPQVQQADASQARHSVAAAKALKATGPKAQQPILVAAMGDSLTDDYTFEGQSTLGAQFANRATTRNWVSNLMALRAYQLTFGDYSTVSRGGSRQQGFAQNWAISGEPAVGVDANGKNVTFLNQYEGFPGTSIPGMLTQTPNATGDVDPKSIKVVTIYIGTNDYNAALIGYAETNGQYNILDSKPGTTNALNAKVEDAIMAAVEKIRSTIPGVKVVVVTPQDITTTPMLIEKYGAVPGLFDKIRKSLTAFNVDMARIAKQQKLGLVNLQAMVKQMGATPTVAGQALDPQGNGPYIEDTYADGFHFGTVMQGKIAQGVVKQIDALYGRNVVTPLSDADIINYARATQGGVALTRFASPAGPTHTTLTATATSGVGNGLPPTGTVSFVAMVPASPGSPSTAPVEVDLGTATLDATGHASLDVNSLPLGLATYYAIYAGDEFHDSRASVGLTPFELTT